MKASYPTFPAWQLVGIHTEATRQEREVYVAARMHWETRQWPEGYTTT